MNTNEKPNTISRILEKIGLSTNASHYTGRSVEYEDITAKRLYNMSMLIQKNIGEEKQAIFNTMVMDLPTLNATFFIEFALRLQITEWYWDKIPLLKHYSEYYHKDLLNMPICKTTESIKKEFQALLKK